MPHYYFGLEGAVPEDEGEELPNDDAARAVAAKVAEELGRDLAEPPRVLIYDHMLKLID